MFEKLSIFKEFYFYLLKNKKWWLIPLVFVMLIFGILIAFAQTSPVAPFLYTLF